ncbi:bacteriorhodopsin [Phycisphaera mikurensis]|uniref:Bacterial rhodopsin family protein n=1 Tax=Phycisphaera mikurensis (strain NBRC 102666 / KCTC 22515 / FYK2301M01) TaxID=1142394 RepID=I0IGJ9_PHYMF|nr:bacteriorhodopsin [Phycisphaera mikurensis]MBB6442931.1 bacteriorhodopsin [Phycisphaera mikurensis]BAM04387.1 bacterial rhodopsin family protein [Phycisphaera mikurensis NBRC 102666]
MPIDALTTLAAVGQLHNMENFFSYTPGQHFAISQILTFGYGCFLASLIYFLLTLTSIPPRYRLAGILSCCVAATAGFILYHETRYWQQTFVYDSLSGLFVRRPDQMYSNGYRYVNWAITVPLLLMTLMVVIPLAHAAKRQKAARRLVIFGVSMVFCSWVGGFFEADGHTEGGNLLGFWFSYLLGWVFYVLLLMQVFAVIGEGQKHVSAEAGKLLRCLLGLFLVSWTIYAFVLLQPLFWWSPTSVVVRQALFTIADVSSKAVYGILMGRLAVRVADGSSGLPNAYRSLAKSREQTHASGGSDVGVPAVETRNEAPA